MENSQRFCVRWNSYKSNLQTAFPKLLTSEHFVDVTLACEKQFIKCHKIVLSACSVYFENLLINNPCQHPIIFMKDVEFWEIQALVEFMYKGEVNVSQNQLDSLLKSAESLQIRGLCGTKQVVSSDLDNETQEESVSDNKNKRNKSDNDDDENGGKKRKKKAEEEDKCVQITSVRGADEFSKDDKLHNNRQDTQPVVKAEEIDLGDDNYENPYMNPDEQDKDDGYSPDMFYTNQNDDPGPSQMSECTSAIVIEEVRERSGNELKEARENREEKPKTGIPKRRWKSGKRSSYKQYSLASMWAALHKVEQGQSVYRASIEFGVPRKTLRNWMKKYNIHSYFDLKKEERDKQTNTKIPKK